MNTSIYLKYLKICQLLPMSSKKRAKIKSKSLKNIQSLISKNFSLEKIKINPIGVIEKTKNKIENFAQDIKKNREKRKLRLEK